MRHVLVVDDAVLIRSLLRDILRREGYVVHEAVSVRDALARQAEVKPDVVTVDLTLPDGTGLACISAMRKRDPQARVVVISAVARDGSEAAARSAGALEFVAKPFRPGDVTDAVRRALAINEGQAAVAEGDA